MEEGLGFDPGGQAQARYRDWYENRYHAPQDDTTTPIDFAAQAKFHRFYFALAEAVANADAKPEWLPNSPNRPVSAATEPVAGSGPKRLLPRAGVVPARVCLALEDIGVEDRELQEVEISDGATVVVHDVDAGQIALVHSAETDVDGGVTGDGSWRQHRLADGPRLDRMAEFGDLVELDQAGHDRFRRSTGNRRLSEPQDGHHADETPPVVDHADDACLRVCCRGPDRFEDVGRRRQEEGLDAEQPFGFGYGGQPRGLSGSRHVLRPSSAATTDDVGRRHTFLDSLSATSRGRRHVTKGITIVFADSA